MTQLIHRNRPSGLFQSAIKPLSRGIAVAVALAATPLAFAQDDKEQVLEEVLITGSLIKGAQTDSVSNVSVFDRSSMDMQNTPSITDFVKNLSFSSGVDGDSNQFQSNATEGLANINLRGLGPARTLVLINGQRQVAVPVRLGAGRFVDTNNIPSAAVERVEILKEGAAATYGSDAIGGVANFITRSSFEGFEIQGGYTDIADSDGDMNLSAIFGTVIGDFNWVTSVGYSGRSQLEQRDRDWSATIGENFPYGGYSTIGNPGTFYAFADTNPLADGYGADTIVGALPDPGCEDVGNINTGTCNFQYTQFDNLVEDEDHYQIFSELNGEIADGHTMHLEFLYAKTEVPNWATSPSYPPQEIFDLSQRVTTDHPAYANFVAAFPDFGDAIDNTPLPTEYLIFRGRVNGAGAQGPRTAERSYETWRLAGSLDGMVNDDIAYTASASYSHSEGGYGQTDASIPNTKLAFNGYGGADCGATLNNDESINPNGAVAGAGGCSWYNPFSTSIESGYRGQFPNDNYDPTNTNSQELQDWINEEWDVFGENDLYTAEVVFQQSVENIDFAYGAQIRHNAVKQDPGDLGNVAINPCRVPGYQDCVNKTGLHSFLGATSAYDLDQTVYAGFAEAIIQLSDKLEAQVGVRYEDYGSDKSTFDPKMSLQYHINDNLSLRGSVQTTFRGPTPNELDPGSSTALAYVAQAIAFKAIDTTGSADLDPESAFTYNFGVVYSGEDLNASIDYWAFEFENPIVTESYGQLAAAYAAGGEAKAAVQDQITCPGGVTDGSCAASQISRIQANIVNGPRVETSGIDFFVNYGLVAGEMPVTLGLEGTYTLAYDVDSYELNGVQIASGFSAAGNYNFDNNVRPIQDLKMRASVNVAVNQYLNALMYVNYVSEYDDYRAGDANFIATNGSDKITIDDQTTVDLHLSTNLLDDSLTLTASVINATDEDPPVVLGDLMYDGYTHNPLGRMLKVGFKYSM